MHAVWAIIIPMLASVSCLFLLFSVSILSCWAPMCSCIGTQSSSHFFPFHDSVTIFADCSLPLPFHFHPLCSFYSSNIINSFNFTFTLDGIKQLRTNVITTTKYKQNEANKEKFLPFTWTLLWPVKRLLSTSACYILSSILNWFGLVPILFH